MRLPRLILVTLAILAVYAAWPIHAAIQIREAMISGDTAMLARRIEWDAVRASLKASLSSEAIARLEPTRTRPRPRSGSASRPPSRRAWPTP